MNPPVSFPDPLVTANVYCERRQDHFLSRALPGFWGNFRSRTPGRDSYLWFVRYGRGGEHVKLRVHAPEILRVEIADLLGTAIHCYFAATPPPEPSVRLRKNWSSLPPIDLEDDTSGDYPDRSLLWTTYRRSHISLGAKPFLDDDHYAALFTRCLGEGCEMVLTHLVADDQGRVSHNQRQTTLIKLLLLALPTLCPDLKERADYLAYHRDWLVRFSLSQKKADPKMATATVQYFDEQVSVTAASGLDRLRKVAARHWEPNAMTSQDLETQGWCAALRALADYVCPLAVQPGYSVDPYASNPSFAPFFKVLHGIANQVGLTMMNEAYTHHLLLRATIHRENAA